MAHDAVQAEAVGGGYWGPLWHGLAWAGLTRAGLTLWVPGVCSAGFPGGANQTYAWARPWGCEVITLVAPTFLPGGSVTTRPPLEKRENATPFRAVPQWCPFGRFMVALETKSW